MISKTTMAIRIARIKDYLNNEVTTILPAYTFDGKQYVPLSQAEYLVKCINDITRLVNGENLDTPST